MGYNSFGEATGSRRTPLLFAGSLGDLVDTPNVKNVKRRMPTQNLKHGYAFSDAARNAAVQKLLKRLFNEIPASTNDARSNAVDNDCTSTKRNT